MTEHELFLQERDRIDFLIQKGYEITTVTESLNSDFVDFEKEGEDKETLHITTPEGRKYYAVLLIQQQKAKV